MKDITSSEKGFFKEQHIALLKNFPDSELNRFDQLNNEDRFDFIYNNPTVSKFIVQPSGVDKNLGKAVKLKNDGNSVFKKNMYLQASTLYSQSLINCPPESGQEFSIIRANRSAALYHLEKYEEALEDIELVLRSEYPKDLRYKINDRKAKCLLALKKHKSAKIALRETIKSLDDAKLSSDKKQKWQQDIQILLAMMEKCPPNDAKSKSKIQEIVELKGDKNPFYKSATVSVKISSNKNAGRYAEANNKIQIGDVLLTEVPHCSMLLEEYSKTNCFQCFRKVAFNPEPCPTCARVIFCSVQCQQNAMETHHKYECSILPALWNSGASVTCLMSLRIITQQKLDYFIQFKSNIKTIRKSYESSDYWTVYNLVSHESRRVVEDILQRSHMAAFLFKCLAASNYFNQPTDGNSIDLNELKKFIGGLILHNLQTLQFNAHEVSELHINDKSLDNCKSVFIGGAVYPTLALFNHSCNPGIVRYFNGTKIVVRAIRNISKGEMIAENYGPIFTQTPKNERQEMLKSQYWFDCKCEACENNWPVLDKMDVNLLRFKCESKTFCQNVIEVPVDIQHFMIKCQECNQHTNILKGLKLLQDTEIIFRLGRSLMSEGNAEKALIKFLELFNLLDETLAPPFKDYHLCQQVIRTCYLALGNIYLKNIR